jgi:hypothetical protein
LELNPGTAVYELDFFSVLYLLKVVILGYVEKGAAHLCQTAVEESVGGLYSPVFLGLMVHLV